MPARRWRSNRSSRPVFEPGVDPQSLSLSFDGFDLILSIVASGDQLTIEDGLEPSGIEIETYEFADGTVWTHQQVLDILATPLAGDNFILGTVAADVLGGGAGDDRLEGLQGDDSYIFGLGDGQDIVSDTEGAADRLSFGPGITQNDLSASRAADGTSLVLSIVGTGDSVTVEGGIELVEFSDGTSLDLGVFAQQVLESEITSGNDVLVGIEGAVVIDAGAGDDIIQTGVGNTVVFGLGSGNDIIRDNAAQVTVRFGDGLTTQDLSLLRVDAADGQEHLELTAAVQGRQRAAIASASRSGDSPRRRWTRGPSGRRRRE